ncbi:hypothetical protein A1O3_10056 [Capronia epimyces CBS 606.96]|uniref:Calcineurin-like phosphoesterase domain-containing protein n=1 Tax=Capronia epimyces CBS 606.96 TaxID=1182542 RepID=W9Y381_9EURO|nr:uncharacterized protein A1O3_10056 [Capronia epimyces CBS 606.96]EXJ76899.1 hypothetical protein A1O3_10056 [Capronia epimyces CBS 606.96]
MPSTCTFPFSLLPKVLSVRRKRKKLRVQFVSDLHLEVGRQYSSFHIPVRGQILLLAGDIGQLQHYDDYRTFLATQCQKFQLVCLVLGNHEFYGLSRDEGLGLASKLETEPCLSGRLKVLNRNRVDISPSLCILGCTLQSHVTDTNRAEIEAKIKDFRRIKDWSVEKHNEEHVKDREWLLRQLSAVGDNYNVIVMTHHAPTVHGSSKPEDEGNTLTEAFATDLLGTDEAFSRPQWWVFGHTHHTTQMEKHGGILASNQRGYVLKPEAGASTRTFTRGLLCNTEQRRNRDAFDPGRFMEL